MVVAIDRYWGKSRPDGALAESGARDPEADISASQSKTCYSSRTQVVLGREDAAHETAEIRDLARWFDTVATARRVGAAIYEDLRDRLFAPVTSCGGNDRKQQPSLLSRLL